MPMPTPATRKPAWVWRGADAADEKAVKSPASSAGVGTNDSKFDGVLRNCVPWYAPKKKMRSVRTGPPIVPPN